MLAHEILCGFWRASGVVRIEINYRFGHASQETAELVQRIQTVAFAVLCGVYVDANSQHDCSRTLSCGVRIAIFY